jgi:aminoglycoside 3-N-acetyltransferase
MLTTLLAKLRDRTSGPLHALRRRVHGTLTADDLAEALARAGVTPGATVMAHISMNELALAAPEVNALALIRMLEGLLTPTGTLLLLTSPFSGLEASYLATRPSFDVRRTPSRMGLATELLRRMPGTIRSLHPTHPVAARGAHAAELLATHHEGETFAESSPFCLMRAYDGVVIGIGLGVRRAFTITHCGEYLHPRAREYAFSPTPSVVSVTDGERTMDYSFHPLQPGLDRQGRTCERVLRARGVLKYERHAGMLVASSSADAFIEETRRLISEGSYYGSGPLARR